MREIKFRAWDKDNKRMVTVKSIHLMSASSDYTVVIEPMEFFASEHLELMQYTGLKDENSIEIYEGDIVKIGCSDQIGEAHHWKTTIKNPFDYSTEEALNLIHAEYIEIIGNIYENPELLNG